MEVGASLRLQGFVVSARGDPRALRATCSHTRRVSLEDSLLLSLLFQGTASFERHRRSVQARVPLREATRVKAARRQRAQASRAAFGMCGLSGDSGGKNVVRVWCVGV